MNILLASSEVIPFAKSGGLGDVCGALPKQLAEESDIDVVVFLPAFRCVFESGMEIESTGLELSVPIGSKVVRGNILKSTLPGTDVIVYLIEQPDYFDRRGLYNENGVDYPDNCERFIFFCRSVLESMQLLELDIDLIHCNDWQTGLIPAYIDIEYRKIPRFEKVATLMTIHNLAYQGWFWHWDMALTGLDWRYFNWQQMEFYNKLNLLKTGIVFSDQISTVSEKYAEEIQTEEHGCGLQGVLSDNHDRLCGIINGVDYGQWSPDCDPHIATKYSVDDWQAGKLACKTSLQKKLGLPENPDVPVIGLIGRLAEQKGWDYVIDMIRMWAPEVDAQWAILGTGDAKFEEALEELSRVYPDKVAAKIDFANDLAHQIEAGADIFLMPSRYEPCGLNQMYSLKYGAVPIVHHTGGLADTIVDATPENMENKTANGFSFDRFEFDELKNTMHCALDMFRNQPEQWKQIVETGMKQDFSWKRSAEKYVSLYQKIVKERLSKPRPAET